MILLKLGIKVTLEDYSRRFTTEGLFVRILRSGVPRYLTNSLGKA